MNLLEKRKIIYSLFSIVLVFINSKAFSSYSSPQEIFNHAISDCLYDFIFNDDKSICMNKDNENNDFNYKKYTDVMILNSKYKDMREEIDKYVAFNLIIDSLRKREFQRDEYNRILESDKKRYYMSLPINNSIKN